MFQERHIILLKKLDVLWHSSFQMKDVSNEKS